jgi:adenine phosphoribosyltransferase
LGLIQLLGELRFVSGAIQVHQNALTFFLTISLDARGFILGPPIALALKKPFIMMRKQGKMPNSISSQEYDTEYGKRSGLTVQRDKIKKGDRVLIIDDLVATGGTLSSAVNLVHLLGGTGAFMLFLFVIICQLLFSLTLWLSL